MEPFEVDDKYFGELNNTGSLLYIYLLLAFRTLEPRVTHLFSTIVIVKTRFKITAGTVRYF